MKINILPWTNNKQRDEQQKYIYAQVHVSLLFPFSKHARYIESMKTTK